MNNYSGKNLSKRYGLMTVFSSWLAVFCLFGYRATFAILKTPMSADLGWTQSEITLGYSVMMAIYAVTAYFCGMILDKWGTRPVYAIATVLGGLGFILTAQINEYMAYLVTFGIVGGVATGMLWVTSTVSVRKWYVGKTYGTMWGIAFSGAPLAQFILAYVTKEALSSGEADAWRGAMSLLGAIMFLILALAVVMARRSPADYKLEPNGTLPDKKTSSSYEWSVKQAFKKYAIWGVILMFLTSMMAEFLIWTQVVSFWTSDLNWTSERAINVYSIIGLVGIFSMPIMGRLSDIIVGKSGCEASGRKLMLIIGPTTGVVACFLLLSSGQSNLIAYLSCIIFAVYWAIVPGGVVGYTGAIFGQKTLGKIWGMATLIVMGIGPFAGSYIGGWLKDFSGSYTYSIYYAIGSFLISILLALSLPKQISLPDHSKDSSVTHQNRINHA